MQPFIIVLIVVVVLVLFMMFLMLVTRYKKCPPDKIMVIFGKVGSDKEGNNRSAKCIHGGAAVYLAARAVVYLSRSDAHFHRRRLEERAFAPEYPYRRAPPSSRSAFPPNPPSWKTRRKGSKG